VTTVKTPNWRDAIASNKKKSNIVIVLYVVIYTLLGFIIDLALYFYIFNPRTALSLPSLSSIPNYYYAGYVPPNRWGDGFFSMVGDAIHAYGHGMIIPYATMGAFIIAIVCLLAAMSSQRRLVLSGTKYYLLDEGTARSDKERQLLNVVDEMVIAMGLKGRPQIYVIDALYMNAFASGYSENSSLVAITQPLLDELDRSELQAVIAHELSHIKHLDTKLLVTASVLTSLIAITVGVLFELCRGFVWGIGNSRGRRRSSGINPIIILLLVFFMLRMLLPVINMFLLRFLSRKREFMADAGAVAAMRDNQPLARALTKIHDAHVENEVMRQAYLGQANESVRAAAYIYSPEELFSGTKKFMYSLMATHPTLGERLEALAAR
jgi:heat shock protein HtpX